MNAPFKVEEILADAFVGISELKKNPAAVIKAAQDQQVAILNRNKIVAYVISPEVWEFLCEFHEDIQDIEILKERLAKPGKRIEVSLDDL